MTRMLRPTFKRGSRLTAADLNRLSRAIPEITGDGNSLVSRSGSQFTVSSARQPMPLFPLFYARVLSSTQLAANRWSYEIEQIIKADAGYSLPEVSHDGGYTGTAYNMLELGNDEAGMMGNGVNTNDLPPGFSLGPIPAGPWPHAVFVWRLANEDARSELWMHYPNPIVGSCP